MTEEEIIQKIIWHKEQTEILMALLPEGFKLCSQGHRVTKDNQMRDGSCRTCFRKAANRYAKSPKGIATRKRIDEKYKEVRRNKANKKKQSEHYQSSAYKESKTYIAKHLRIPASLLTEELYQLKLASLRLHRTVTRHEIL